MTGKMVGTYTVVLGITSGIAAYKMPGLAKMLVADGIVVEVVMTDSARKMVDPKEFEAITGRKVHASLFEEGFEYKDILSSRRVDHIALADAADVILIAPATANVIAKLAHGIADDFLTTMVLAGNSPIILSPSMNVHMWNNPVTQQNISILKQRGYSIIPPERGMLACGYEGPGRLPHLQKLRKEVLKLGGFSHSLKGKKIIVTAGGTTERIDDARVITNRSSGKMGIALAEECYLRGAEVILLRAKTSVAPRYLMREEMFETSDELRRSLKKMIKGGDVVFHCAAVSDFKPRSVSGKISSKKNISVEFVPEKKIITEIKKWNPGIVLIGFKATSGDAPEYMYQKGVGKIREARADAVVVNDISRSDRGFEAETNEVLLVYKDGSSEKIPLQLKRGVAEKIVAHCIEKALF
ncbi:MAG: hypothetical protein RLZZ455_802 [Candidatus Parcubacteria bacterium]|jgi:phosphopantothenoylcysteine decarboxylase/phosphopantothenate--cysteine ligase